MSIHSQETEAETTEEQPAREAGSRSPDEGSIADLQASPGEIPGVVTQAYRANPEKVIERLNQLRSTEMVSYLQYKQHAYMAVSLLGPSVKAEFVEHADEELRHADMLAERIAQLGGVPWYDMCRMAQEAERHQVRPEQGATLEQMVMADLEIERAQLEAYRRFIQELGNDDPATRRLLEDILIDTEHHAAELGDLLRHRS